MNLVSNEKKSQKEIFEDAYNQLKHYSLNIVNILVTHIYQLIVNKEMVLDNVLVRMYIVA